MGRGEGNLCPHIDKVDHHHDDNHGNDDAVVDGDLHGDDVDRDQHDENDVDGD